MVSIARQILFHDKVRFAITVVSLGFAMVMIIYDTGMFFGVTGDSVSIAEHTHAEIWVAESGEAHLGSPSLVATSELEKVRTLEAVSQACALDYFGGNLKIADTRQVQIIGIDPACSLIQPWSIKQGDVTGLQQLDTIVVDDMALRGIDHAQIGDTVKLNDRNMRIVAVTHGNKSFSYPFVYVSLETFVGLGGKPGYYNYIAAKLKPGTNQAQIIQQLADPASKLVAIQEQDFKSATVTALIAQGVGMIFVIVFVGVLVGLLIITMTLYTATMEQLRDFAILKALGATRWKVRGVVLEQAITETTVSFALGLAASLGINAFVEGVSGIRGSFPAWVIFASYVVMILLAVFGSLLSIRKATSVDPVMVFRA
jgi:putative ABC transport system permease protein